jgi:hypothetical protein
MSNTTLRELNYIDILSICSTSPILTNFYNYLKLSDARISTIAEHFSTSTQLRARGYYL